MGKRVNNWVPIIFFSTTLFNPDKASTFWCSSSRNNRCWAKDTHGKFIFSNYWTFQDPFYFKFCHINRVFDCGYFWHKIVSRAEKSHKVLGF